MTPQVFETAGLDKLTPRELSILGRWISAYASSVAKQATRENPLQVIETNIDGEYNGWEGETVYKMMNGPKNRRMSVVRIDQKKCSDLIVICHFCHALSTYAVTQIRTRSFSARQVHHTPPRQCLAVVPRHPLPGPEPRSPSEGSRVGAPPWCWANPAHPARGPPRDSNLCATSEMWRLVRVALVDDPEEMEAPRRPQVDEIGKSRNNR
jgi:hypothetical protein